MVLILNSSQFPFSTIIVIFQIFKNNYALLFNFSELIYLTKWLNFF